MEVNIQLTSSEETEEETRWKGLPCVVREADCSGNASSPHPTKETIHFLHSCSFYGAMIHSDGVREQVFAPRFSIKSQALEEEMKNDFPIFGYNQFGKMAHSLSLRGALRFSLIVVISHLKANASTCPGSPLPCRNIL